LLNLAQQFTEDPIFEGAFSVGLDLKKIRSAKVYTIGKATNMGLTAIVEAKDEAGNDLTYPLHDNELNS
jgi:hypothetical protein